MQLEAIDTTLYLIGLATVGGHPHFADPFLAESLVACVRQLRTERVFAQHAYVVMPDAYFAIVTPSNGISRTLKKLRSATTEILSIESLWAPGFMRRYIEDVESLLLHAGNLHLMPVLQGLVEDPEAYPFSSLSTLDADPV